MITYGRDLSVRAKEKSPKSSPCPEGRISGSSDNIRSTVTLTRVALSNFMIFITIFGSIVIFY